MNELEKQERKKNFQQLLDGTDDDLLCWVGNRVFVEAKMRLVMMPWDTTSPAEKLKNTIKQPVLKPAIKTKTESKPPTVALNIGYQSFKWVPILEAPKVKKSAHNLVSYHLVKGAMVQFKAFGGEHVGMIEQCQKTYAKIKYSGGVAYISYPYIHHVDLKSSPKYKKALS